MPTAIYYGKPGSKAALLREAAHQRLLAHEAAGDLPTSNRFILYELRQDDDPALFGSKSRGRGEGARSEDQNLSDASKWLRDEGIVPWHWLTDETRDVTTYLYAPTVADYVMDAVDQARIDLWDGGPPPLLLCESRTFGGVLKRTVAPTYLCAVTSTNGQVGGFLHTDVAPLLTGDSEGRAVLYIGDYDVRGSDIERNTRRVLEAKVGPLNWKRVALTGAQVSHYKLTPVPKLDRVKGGSFPAVEVESLGQGVVTAIIEAALDALLPEPLDVVLAREDEQRERVREALRALLDGEDGER